MNEDMAYLIGVYLSDGSAHHTERNWIFSLTVRDQDFLKETQETLERLFGKVAPIYQDRETLWKISFYSKDLVLYLWDITSHKHKIPESILENTIQIKLAFTAGFLDGDGFVSHNVKGQYQVGFVGTEDWVRDSLPGLLQSLGVKTNKVSTKWPQTQFKANKPLHRVTVNVHSFIAAGGYAKMGRKEERLQEYYVHHQAEFTDAEKQRRYKRKKLSSPSETVGFYGNA